jgi:hypothetical protein
MAGPKVITLSACQSGWLDHYRCWRRARPSLVRKWLPGDNVRDGSAGGPDAI